jgi:hypothetical protein
MSRTKATHKPTLQQRAREHARQEVLGLHDQLQAASRLAGEGMADFANSRLARNYQRKQAALRQHYARDAPKYSKVGSMHSNPNAFVSIGGTPSKAQKLQGLHETYKMGGAGYKAARERHKGRPLAAKTKVAIDLPGARKTIAKKPISRRYTHGSVTRRPK